MYFVSVAARSNSLFITRHPSVQRRGGHRWESEGRLLVAGNLASGGEDLGGFPGRGNDDECNGRTAEPAYNIRVPCTQSLQH